MALGSKRFVGSMRAGGEEGLGSLEVGFEVAPRFVGEGGMVLRIPPRAKILVGKSL